MLSGVGHDEPRQAVVISVVTPDEVMTTGVMIVSVEGEAVTIPVDPLSALVSTIGGLTTVLCER